MVYDQAQRCRLCKLKAKLKDQNIKKKSSFYFDAVPIIHGFNHTGIALALNGSIERSLNPAFMIYFAVSRRVLHPSPNTLWKGSAMLCKVQVQVLFSAATCSKNTNKPP